MLNYLSSYQIFQPEEVYFKAWITNAQNYNYFKSSAILGMRFVYKSMSIKYSSPTTKKVAFLFLAGIAGFITLAAGILISPFLLIGSGIASNAENKKNAGSKKVANNKQEHLDTDDESFYEEIFSTITPIKVSDFFNNTCRKLKKLFTKKPIESSEENPAFSGEWGFTEEEAFGPYLNN